MSVDIQWHGDDFKDDVEKRSRNAIKAVVFHMQKAIKKKLSKGGSKGVHSRPGQAPFVQTNRLRASIQTLIKTQGGKTKGFVGTNVEYAAILEFGGITGKGKKTRIAPRPYFRNTIRKEFKRAQNIYAKAMRL